MFVVLAAIAVLALFVRAHAGDARGPDAHHAAGAAAGDAPLAAGRSRATCRCCCSWPACRSSRIALADPHTGFTREEVSYPGRRIALLVDASTSMVMQFKTQTMKTQGEATFFTAVAGAEQFIRRRMNGPYRDLVALIQFGNQAYVVTPFTTDYENILLSIRLVSDPREWGRFSDWGTTIIEGIDQATKLFKTFSFVNASGNLMVVFTDGRDSDLQPKGRPLENLIAEARTWKIPVHMIRTAYNRREGEVVQDKIWRPTVERTGGRFYAAYDEESMIARAARDRSAVAGPHRRARVQRAAAALCGLCACRDRAVADGGAAEAGIWSVPDVSVNHEGREVALGRGRACAGSALEVSVKSITAYLVAAVLFVAVGVAALTAVAARAPPGRRAGADRHAAVRRWRSRASTRPRATSATRGGCLASATRRLREVRARQAALQYWQGDYAEVLPAQAEPVAAVDETNVELQLVVANAAFRAGLKGVTERTAAVQALNEAANGYLTVLKNNIWHEDAALQLRVRRSGCGTRWPRDAGRRQSSRQQGVELGREGAPSDATTTKGFQIYIPLEGNEKSPEGGDAGKAEARRLRKG